MIDSDVFEMKFIDNWEDEAAFGWPEMYKHFGDEYDKIGRARAPWRNAPERTMTVRRP